MLYDAMIPHHLATKQEANNSAVMRKLMQEQTTHHESEMELKFWLHLPQKSSSCQLQPTTSGLRN